jgi:hypothetical protein
MFHYVYSKESVPSHHCLICGWLPDGEHLKGRPLDDQAAYFAYWEAQRQERIRRQRVEEGTLSNYEQSRRPY